MVIKFENIFIRKKEQSRDLRVSVRIQCNMRKSMVKTICGVTTTQYQKETHQTQ